MPQRPRVILINPWIYDFAATNLWARPLGLLRVAEALSQFDLDLKFIDCCDTFTLGRHNRGRYPKVILPTPKPVAAMTRAYGRYGLLLEDFQAQLRAALPAQAVFMTSIMTYWYPGVQEAIRQIRAVAPRIPIVLGGIYPRLFPDHAQAVSGADQVFGQALDDGLAGLLNRLGLPADPVQPSWPYYRLGLYARLPYAPVLTSEGCPYHCAYCASRVLYPVFRQRAWEQVFQEIQDLAGLGVQDLAFYDDALLVNAEDHLCPLLEHISQRLPGLRFHTPNGLHARWLSRSLATRLRQAGFTTLRLSLETVNPERALQTGGKIRTDEFAAAVENLHSAGFTKTHLGAYLMYGLPGQSLAEVREGVDFLHGLGVTIHLTEYSPLPKTPMWDQAVASGLLPPEADPLLTNNSVFSALLSGLPAPGIKALKDHAARCNQSAA